MAGVKGRSGRPGIPKSKKHCKAISDGLRRHYEDPKARAQQAQAQAESFARRRAEKP